MNIILCIDEKFGLSFNRRRQSQDRTVNEKILALSSSSRLLMSEYSSPLFQDLSLSSHVLIQKDFLKCAQEGDFCFVEEGEIPLEKAEKLYLFHWNRKYPADRFLTADLKEMGFKKESKEEFEGNSHKKITLEIYKKVL